MSETSPFKDNYWDIRGSSRLLTYVGPSLEKNLEISAVKQFVHEKGAWGAIWNYDHDYIKEGPWYRCICDIVDYDINNIEIKNASHNVKRSLERCTFRKVDFQWLADTNGC